MDELILWLPDIKFRHQPIFGSKAVNLGVIARELRTPAGFCLSAAAYQNTLKQAGVLKQISALVENVESKDLESLNQVSQEIFHLMENIKLPPEIAAELEKAYDDLVKDRSRVYVAVRSSATAEDLPSASFAGQLESFLNLASFSQTVEAVKRCWASLWTARAIHYRFQRGIGQTNIAMAVIIQEMVPAQAAGVMFTANPISGSRKEFYIEAVKGLGEGLVLGKMNADRYLVLKDGFFITSKETVEKDSYLNDFQIKILCDFGAKLEFMYQDYQDIEWALYKGELFILQTRPITTLDDEEPEFPDENKMTPIQKEVWINVNERFPEPILPIDGIIAKIYYLSLFNAYQELGFSVPYVDWHQVEQGLFPEFFVPPAIKPNLLRPIKFWKTVNWNIEAQWENNEKAFNRYLKLLKDPLLKDFPLEIIMEYLEDSLKDFQRTLTFRYLLYIQYGALYNVLARLFAFFYGKSSQRILEGLVVGHP